jgi:hypothetical protein
MVLFRKHRLSGTGQTGSVQVAPWLIAGPPDAFRRLCYVPRTPTLVQTRSVWPPHQHFGNHKTKRNLQDGLRICLLDFPGKARVMHPRRFARIRPTGRDSNVAKLIVGPKAPVIDCKVVDYSPGGACLEIGGQTKLPDRFELLFGGTKKRCRVVWNVGRRLGVAF